MAANLGGNVETQDFASLPHHNKTNFPINQFGPQSKNLASIVREYKIGVKKYATMHNINFVWPSRYHDHIIRNENEYRIKSTYIINNPLKWNNDK